MKGSWHHIGLLELGTASVFEFASLIGKTVHKEILTRSVASLACRDNWEQRNIDFDIINAADAEGRTILHLAIASGSPETLALILREDAVDFKIQVEPSRCPFDLFRKDAHGRTALHWAAHSGLAAACQQLLKIAGNDLFFVFDDSGSSPLQYAVNAQHVDVAEVIHTCMVLPCFIYSRFSLN